MTDRFRREAGGVALILASLFSAWALGRGATDGPIAEWWGSALRGLFGYAAGLVPVLIALTAIRAFRDQDGPVLLLRHYLGAAGYLIAATGMVHLAELGSGAHPGGGLGRASGGVVEGALGQFASGILLTAIGLTSVFCWHIWMFAPLKPRSGRSGPGGGPMCQIPLRCSIPRPRLSLAQQRPLIRHSRQPNRLSMSQSARRPRAMEQNRERPNRAAHWRFPISRS